MFPECFLKQENRICSLCTDAIMRLLALSCNRWKCHLPPTPFFGDKVNGFPKGRAERAADLARLVPSIWLLIESGVLIGTVWEGDALGNSASDLSPGRIDTGHGCIEEGI